MEPELKIKRVFIGFDSLLGWQNVIFIKQNKRVRQKVNLKNIFTKC